MIDVGRMIAAARTERQLSQQQLADKLGCSKQAISNYERNTREPDYVTLEAIADVLNKPVTFFISPEDKNRSLYAIYKTYTGDGDSEPETGPEISDLDLALYGEIRVMSEAKKREALDLFRFLRQQDEKQRMEEKRDD